MALVEAAGRAALQDVQAERARVAVVGQEPREHRGAEARALVFGRQIEVLQPPLVGFRTEGDQPGRDALDLDHRGVFRSISAEEALTHAGLVVATEALEVGSHDDGTQLDHPGRVVDGGGAECPGGGHPSSQPSVAGSG